MSILIKGMEMPQEKKIMLTIFPDGRVYENHGERLWGQGEYCIPWKAVPVPPHGRLGDLDELHKEAVRRSEKAGAYDSFYNCTDRVISAVDIENAPTIIPAEEGE